jgi:hypothetical protein
MPKVYFKPKHEDEVKPTLHQQNKIAVDSSKEEEIDAICKARNVPANASGAEKLKALDQEYHYLMENGQGPKAEQVQLLYQFKAKKMNTVNVKIRQIQLVNFYFMFFFQA